MHKVANYRRVVWLSPSTRTLEELLTEAFSKCPDVKDTKFEYSGSIDVQISETSLSGVGSGFYFTLYAEGRLAATVQNGGKKINRTKAPKGEEFLRTGIYFVAEGNNAGYVASGQTNDGQITGILHKFLIHCGVPKAQTQFALMAKADRREIQKLLRAGVKSIDLGVSAFTATIEELNENSSGSKNPIPKLASGMQEIKRGIFSIFGSDRTPQQIEAASEIEARVRLGYDGRSANTLLPQIMSSMAEDITTGSDDFKIITSDDVTITKDKLVIRRDIEIEGDELALDPVSAFGELRIALAKWRDSGIFEE
jgi:hypothetical protein